MQVESIPTFLSDYWGINLGSAQAILSIVVIMSVLLPLIYFQRGKSGVLLEVIVLIIVEALLVGIGWLPFWLLVATVAALALGIALLGTKMVTGG